MILIIFTVGNEFLATSNRGYEKCSTLINNGGMWSNVHQGGRNNLYFYYYYNTMLLLLLMMKGIPFAEKFVVLSCQVWAWTKM